MSIQGSINQMLGTVAAGAVLTREGLKGRIEKEQSITDLKHENLASGEPKSWQEAVDAAWLRGYTPEELKEMRSGESQGRGGIIGDLMDLKKERRFQRTQMSVSGPSVEDLTAKEFREYQRWKSQGELRINQKKDFSNLLRDSKGRFTKKGVDDGKR